MIIVNKSGLDLRYPTFNDYCNDNSINFSAIFDFLFNVAKGDITSVKIDIQLIKQRETLIKFHRIKENRIIETYTYKLTKELKNPRLSSCACVQHRVVLFVKSF